MKVVNGTMELQNLVKKFQNNEAEYLLADYNETQTRTHFITPLLECFGWDVLNKKSLPFKYREVTEEAPLAVQDHEEELSNKRPDYEMKIARERKFFVEAKKPSVNIETHKKSAFQIRRYGFSAGLPISILTNFKHIAIYDTTIIPNNDDDADVARIALIHFEDFELKKNVLDKYLLRSQVSNKEYWTALEKQKKKGALEFDLFFLEKIKQWRKVIAREIYQENSDIEAKELTHYTQQFISRLIFLRICEDRRIEEYEQLLKSADCGFKSVMSLLRKVDEVYNSGLFSIYEQSPITISDQTIKAIIHDLYYPNCPYTFSVVDTEILGGIYDQFLGEELVLENGVVESKLKPEIREASGVVTTPRYIVDKIVSNTLKSKVANLTFEDVQSITILDVCCGSGVFLISAYEYLLDYYLNYYIQNKEDYEGDTIYLNANNEFTLTFDCKSQILCRHLRGVDIDLEAVELAKLGLYLKLIENENKDTLKEIIVKGEILPSLERFIKCGNSLISHKEWNNFTDNIEPNDEAKLNLFDWKVEFPDEMKSGGFSIVIGNPPYVRIQKMANYSQRELNYYQSGKSPYSTATKSNMDKYFLFIEKSMSLITDEGLVSLIVPNKFLTIKYADKLRLFLSHNRYVQEIIHFGALQVFKEKASNYTCILKLSRTQNSSVLLSRVSEIKEWVLEGHSVNQNFNADNFSDEPWVFANPQVQELFDIASNNSESVLQNIADIYVALQTSADDVYIVKSQKEDSNFIYKTVDGVEYGIEKNILKKCIQDVQLTPYKQAKSNSWMIFPYHYNEKGKAILYTPTEMEELFPGAYEYLTIFRSQLKSRSINGGKKGERQWYQFGRSQSLNKFDNNKIVLTVLAENYKYTPDYESLALTGGGNGPYYLIKPKNPEKYSMEFILAVLNNELNEARVRTCTSIFSGSYYSHGKEFIKNLYIPKATQKQRDYITKKARSLIDKLTYVDELQGHERTMAVRKISAMEIEIKESILSLFNLTDSDSEILKNCKVDRLD